MFKRLQFEEGQKFGELTVLGRDDAPRKWLCKCSCGKIKSVYAGKLNGGHTKSCGHFGRSGVTSRTHGDSGSREYNIWTGIIKRCYNQKCPAYPRYGGRGIAMCDRWRNDYAMFLADMGRTPFPGAEIDRIDNDGDYEPGNCRWATRKEQSNNKSTMVYFEYDGRRQKVAEWAKELGVPVKTFRLRVWKGWTPEEVMRGRRVKANGKTVRTLTYDGVTLPVGAWARRLGVWGKTMYRRIDRGWSDSEIITGKRSTGEQQ